MATSHAWLSVQRFCSAVSHVHAHEPKQTWVCAGPQAYVHLWGLEGRRKRSDGEQWGGARRSSPQSLHRLQSFPPLWEPSKESVSRITAPVILCPTVPVSVCAVYINIYRFISRSDSSVEIVFFFFWQDLNWEWSCLYWGGIDELASYIVVYVNTVITLLYKT